MTNDPAKNAAVQAAKARYERMRVRFFPVPGVVYMMVSSGSAARMREKRIREALGIDLVSHVPVRNYFRLVDFLIDGGFISEEASADRGAVSAALGAYLDSLIVTRNSLSK
ncbi:hypothetical protein [Bradyrhizobium diazoefficiens]|uniref:hypothetical protein n=1 Tax=Bradyrhizobium diazoefficiens TaxID=1355477 RepID=UPI00272D44FF|nr:hypothetical protein [Bradyrhizobium diazoefficiens]WLA62375.1 hypothetical protein QNN01_28335 [Bradyrhizobium diazoefficiens]